MFSNGWSQHDPSHLIAALFLGGALLMKLIINGGRKRRTREEVATKTVSWPKVPGGIPILGNSIGNVDNLCIKIEDWAAKYGKENGIFEFNIFGVRYVVLCDDSHASMIERQRPYKMQRLSQVNEAVKSIGADGLFAAEGHLWKKDRRIIGPSLSHKNVKDYLCAVKLVSNRLVETLESLCHDNDAVAINNHILSSTVDIISLVAFDKDIDSLRKGSYGMGADLRTSLRVTQLRVLSPIPYWRIPIIGQYIDGAGWAIKRLGNSFRDWAHENESSATDDATSKTFLSKILSLSRGNSADAMSERRLIGNIMTMFAAGSETTHVTICSSLWEIANDTTGLQKELAAEALEVHNYEGAGLDELTNGLPRLRSLIYEILRIRGPSPVLGLQNMEEFELAGTKLPPHTSFFLAWRYISTLDNTEPSRLTPLGPRNTPRSEVCARRWLTTSGNNISVVTPTHKNGWRPFGTGVRVCPGRELAEIEMLAILSLLLRKFEISLEHNHPPMKLVSCFTESPNIDIRLVLKPRGIIVK